MSAWWHGEDGGLDTTRGDARAAHDAAAAAAAADDAAAASTSGSGSGSGPGPGSASASSSAATGADAALAAAAAASSSSTSSSSSNPAQRMPTAVERRTKPEADPSRAVLHGLDFLYTRVRHLARPREATAVLQTLGDVAAVAPEPVRARCIAMLYNEARRWRAKFRDLPPAPEPSSSGADVDRTRCSDLFLQLQGVHSLENAGLEHELKIKLFDEMRGLQKARSGPALANALFGFDPAAATQELDTDPARRAPRTSEEAAAAMSKLAAALLRMYITDALTLHLECASYASMLRLVDLHRPYAPGSSSLRAAQRELVIAVVMTLSGFGELRLMPSLLPQEYAFLVAERHVVDDDDDEFDVLAVAQTLLCLRIFGHTEEGDPSVRAMTKRLLAAQRETGEWSRTAQPTGNDDDDEEEDAQLQCTQFACAALLQPRFRGYGPQPGGCAPVMSAWQSRWHAEQGGADSSSSSSSSNSNDKRNLNHSVTFATLGVQVASRPALDHIVVLYDKNAAARRHVDALPLKERMRLRMKGLVDWKEREDLCLNEDRTDGFGVGMDDEDEDEDDEDATGTGAGGRSKKRGKPNKLRKRSQAEVNQDPRVMAVRTAAKGAKSEDHWVSRLLSSIKKWDGEKISQRDAMIEAVDDDGRVDVAGTHVSLYDLFQQVAKIGGLDAVDEGRKNKTWMDVARMMQLPEHLPKRDKQIRELYAKYIGRWELAKVKAYMEKRRRKTEASSLSQPPAPTSPSSASSSSSASSVAKKSKSRKKRKRDGKSERANKRARAPSLNRHQPNSPLVKTRSGDLTTKALGLNTVTKATALYRKSMPWTGQREFKDEETGEQQMYQFEVDISQTDISSETGEVLFRVVYKDGDVEDHEWMVPVESDEDGLLNLLDEGSIERILTRQKHMLAKSFMYR